MYTNTHELEKKTWGGKGYFSALCPLFLSNLPNSTLSRHRSITAENFVKYDYIPVILPL